MFLWGHEHILDQALKEDGDERLERLQAWARGAGMSTVFIDYSTLRKGLFFPDRPCAELSLQSYPKGLRATIKQYTLCHLWHVASELKNPRKADSFVYQSHDGIFATFHSMNPAQGMTVEAVRNLIVQQATTFYSLALYDRYHSHDPGPSLFWLGVVLHIVQDSYSPAHTVRRARPGASTSAAPPKVKTLSMAWDTDVIPLQADHPIARTVRRMDQWTHDRRFRHTFFEAPSSDEAFRRFLTRLEQKDPELYRALGHRLLSSPRRRRLQNMFDLFLFFAQIQETLVQHNIRIPLAHSAPPDDTLLIGDFFHYPTQIQESRWNHFRGDMLVTVEKQGTLAAAVYMTRKVLQRFRADLEAVEHGAPSEATKRKRWRRAVIAFGTWLVKEPFALDPDTAQKKAGWSTLS